MAAHDKGRLGNQQLAVGAADVQDLDVEAPETIAERITRHGWLASQQILIVSSCGMNRTRQAQSISGARRILCGRVARSDCHRRLASGQLGRRAWLRRR